MSYDTHFYNSRWWITTDGKLLAGYNANDLRSYVFPFYSPKGALVLQESPPDHPHHQGICIGLEVDGHDIWNAGSFGNARHFQEMDLGLECLKPQIDAEGVTIAHAVSWKTESGDLLLSEERRVRFSNTGSCNRVRWHSTLTAVGPTLLGKTKESGIGVRVPPHWETRWGGEIRNAEGLLGEENTFDKMSSWVNVEGIAFGQERAGVILRPLPESESCPWFTRDYGPQLYNPLRHNNLELTDGESFSWDLDVVAYDGARSLADISGLLV